eukprot:4264102-Amphidinium_carterae.1
MKFTKQFDASMVYEWRSVYIDYKAHHSQLMPIPVAQTNSAKLRNAYCVDSKNVCYWACRNQ